MKKIDFIEEIKSYSLNDIGISKLFIDMFEEELLFCNDIGVWYIWNGKHWQPDADEGGRRFEMLKDMANYCNLQININTFLDDKMKEAYHKSFCKLFSKSYRDTIIKDATSVRPVHSSQFNKHKFLFNCQNGTFDFETGNLKPFQRTDYLTDISNVKYNADAKAPQFLKYLDEVMESDAKKTDYLMKIASYCLTGDTSEECFFILYGDKTRNGKSTFVGTLAHLSGTYYKTLAAASITRKQMNNGAAGPSPDIAKLSNARIAAVSEIEDGMLLDIALMKRMTGNTGLSARFLHKNEFEFMPQFKIVIDTNDLPRMTDDSIFKSDRIHLICFDRHFEKHERDLNLKDKLKKETPGIFNLLAKYYKKYKAEGFIMPDSTLQTISKYQLNSNNILAFKTEKLHENTSFYEKSSDLFKSYCEWCEENGLQPRAKKNFKDGMQKLGAVYLEEKQNKKNNQGTSENTYWVRGFGLTASPAKPWLLVEQNDGDMPF